MAVGDVLARWDTRRDWSGEHPASGAYALARFQAFNETSGLTRTFPDAADPARTWTVRNVQNTAGLSAGRWGNNLSLNRSAPSTEQTSVVLPNRAGMWPASGTLLFRAWAALTFSMQFTPIISTRGNAGVAPLVYLSTLSDGRPRAMIYNAAGTAILDQSESGYPWTQAPNAWVEYLWAVNLDAKTSQLAMVNRNTGQTWVGPVRTFTGTPNAACTADMVVGALTPAASYWAGGYIDEVGYWQHTGSSVDLAALVSESARSLSARGSDVAASGGLVVTDGGVSAPNGGTLMTGARPAAWTTAPALSVLPATASTPSASLSTDGGATWDAPATLPEAFTGLVRWSLPLASGDTVQAIELTERPAPPKIGPGGVLPVVQGGTVKATVSGTWDPGSTFTVAAATGLSVVFDADYLELSVSAGWVLGALPVTVTVDDPYGGTASATWMVEVSEAPDVGQRQMPIYAAAPLILYSALDDRADVVADPVAATITTEVNGEQTLVFALPERHRSRPLIRAERLVEVADELYRIRRVTSYREGGVPMVEVYCEAGFYDLGTAGQVDAREFSGVQPGTVMAYALAGTGWTIGRVNVTTSRTWQVEEGSPLAALRQVAKVHGGDLVFDNKRRTVSLLTFAGQRNGLSFLYGQGLTGGKRVEDTTALVTRIYARNADGLTIADVNGGVPYLEDTSWTSEIRSAVYDFAAGTNPYTMLAMTRATLARRARPDVSYELSVVDLSAWSGQALDRFGVGDEVLVVDDELGIRTTDRIVRLEYDLLRPWASKVTLAAKLRQLGDDTTTDGGTLTTGTDIDTRDMVPFNLLQNARFDNGLAHWAASGAVVVPEGETGPNAVQLAGGGTRWIEQTVAPDTRDVYTLSFVMGSTGWPEGLTPELVVVAEVIYDDGTTETIEQKVS